MSAENENVKEEYDAALLAVEAAKARAGAAAATYFAAISKELFDKYPKLKSFAWTQYTPYFNDGETCHFGVQSYNVWINNWNRDWDNLDDYGDLAELDDGEIWPTDAELQEMESAVETFIDQFSNEDMLKMFGDHVKVIVTTDGAYTESYDHD